MTVAEGEQGASIPKLLVVRIDKEPTLVISSEYEEDARNATKLGTLEEALPKLTTAEVIKIRREIGRLLAEFGATPSREITDFLRSVERIESAPLSPLPAIDPSIKNPFNTSKPLPICLVDADGTVLKPSKKHSIALEDLNNYILEKYPDFGGNPEARERLAKLFKRYKEQEDDILTVEGRQRTKDDLTYEKLIKESGRFHAESMEGVSIYKVFEVGQEFWDKRGLKKQLYDYAPESVKLNSQYGVYTVIITGLPECLAKPLVKELKAQFYIAMKLAVRLDEENPIIKLPASEGEEGAYKEGDQWFRDAPNLICTGELDRNTGNLKGKNQAVDFMVDPDPNRLEGQHPPHSVVYGWGNTASDLPLADAGRDSYHSYDLHGFGMLINITEEGTWELTEKAHYRPKRTGKLRIFGEGTGKVKFLEELDDKLHRTFHNPRNARKIAQILIEHGYTRKEILAKFKKFYKNDPDFALEAGGDLRVLGQSEQFIAECEAFGLGEEASVIVDAFRNDFQSIVPPDFPGRSDSIPPMGRSSTTPPPPIGTIKEVGIPSSALADQNCRGIEDRGKCEDSK